jgi:hypothetical protein
MLNSQAAWDAVKGQARETFKDFTLVERTLDGFELIVVFPKEQSEPVATIYFSSHHKAIRVKYVSDGKAQSQWFPITGDGVQLSADGQNLRGLFERIKREN